MKRDAPKKDTRLDLLENIITLSVDGGSQLLIDVGDQT